MKKILIALSLFLMLGCASTEQPKTETSSPIGNISKAFEKLTFPRF
jgi:uncharacterized protein YcfL